MNVQFAVLTIALLRLLLDAGIERSCAIEFVSKPCGQCSVGESALADTSLA